VLFNSFSFIVFFIVVFSAYWAYFGKKSVAVRNFFLLTASYCFYGCWDWRFLLLIALTSAFSWLSGIFITAGDNEENGVLVRIGRKLSSKSWLALNLVLNFSILAVFKYLGFFVDSFIAMASAIGLHVGNGLSINIILPVGISFYTFQAVSYSIDVYRKEINPTKDWIQFFAFVSFFPQLVAGPIERAKNLLPQFDRLHSPDRRMFQSAFVLIVWGYFKKVMIADRLAVLVESCFSSPADASGFPMLAAICAFAFQLYLDFSAYSDIARGCARLLGFELMINFERPYLSTSFSNFWKRWHISLSSWFMDYLYIPLGGNRKGKARKMLNLLIVFAVSGLWHGASWNFVIWGVSNALFMILLDPVIKSIKGSNPAIRAFKAGFIYVAYALSLVFFRADSFQQAMQCFSSIGFDNFEGLVNHGMNKIELVLSAGLLLLLIVQEVFFECFGTGIQKFYYRLPSIFRWIFLVAIILVIIYFGAYGGGNEHSFIYFQF